MKTKSKKTNKNPMHTLAETLSNLSSKKIHSFAINPTDMVGLMAFQELYGQISAHENPDGKPHKVSTEYLTNADVVRLFVTEEHECVGGYVINSSSHLRYFEDVLKEGMSDEEYQRLIESLPDDFTNKAVEIACIFKNREQILNFATTNAFFADSLIDAYLAEKQDSEIMYIIGGSFVKGFANKIQMTLGEPILEDKISYHGHEQLFRAYYGDKHKVVWLNAPSAIMKMLFKI
jgi:hypothetical protein